MFRHYISPFQISIAIIMSQFILYGYAFNFAKRHETLFVTFTGIHGSEYRLNRFHHLIQLE